MWCNTGLNNDASTVTRCFFLLQTRVKEYNNNDDDNDDADDDDDDGRGTRSPTDSGTLTHNTTLNINSMNAVA